MAVYEFEKQKDFIDGLDGERLREISALQKKLNEYYKEREKVGREVTFGDKLERQENLELYGNITLEKLQDVQQEIDNALNKLGVKIDPVTGKIDASSVTASQDVNSSISKAEATLKSTGDEYKKITDVLYGSDMKDIQAQERNTQNNNEELDEVSVSQGLVSTNNEVRQNIIKRDVEAKRIIEARAKLEAIKDNIDMDAAVHVAKKNRLMLMIEQIKIEVAREAANGTLDNGTLENCEAQISSLMAQISTLENDFVAVRQQHMTNLVGARNELENSQKEIEIEREKVPDKGGYKRSLNYSDEGILCGDKTSVRKNDRTANEEEIFDERGVMVYGVADVLSRTKSINIEGTVVECKTDFIGNNGEFEDSYKIGDLEKLSVTAESNTQTIEEKPDIDEVKNNFNDINEMPIYESMVNDIMFTAGGVPFELAALSSMPPEQRRIIELGLKIIALDSTRNITSNSLVAMYCKDIAKAAIEKLPEIEQNMGEILPPPSLKP